MLIMCKIRKQGKHRDGTVRLGVEFDKEEIKKFNLLEGDRVAVVTLREPSHPPVSSGNQKT